LRTSYFVLSSGGISFYEAVGTVFLSKTGPSGDRAKMLAAALWQLRGVERNGAVNRLCFRRERFFSTRYKRCRESHARGLLRCA